MSDQSQALSEMSERSSAETFMYDNYCMKKFGITLEDLIKSKNLSTRQFAKEIGEKSSTVSEWCGPGGRFPSNPEILRKISNYFNISIHELLYGEPDPTQNTLSNLLEKSQIFTGLYEITIKKVSIDVKSKD